MPQRAHIVDETGGLISASNPLDVLGQDFWLKVAEGAVPGYSCIHKYGMNPDIDSGSGFEALWNGGGAYTGFNATAAELVTVVSDNAADDSAGTGAQTITLHGLDGTGAEVSETVTMDGATPVDSVNSYWRLPRAKVVNVGSGGVNAGTITIAQKVTTANVFAAVPAGYGTTMIGCYTVPLAKTDRMIGWYATLTGRTAADVIVKLKKRAGAGKAWQVMEQISLRSAGTSSVLRTFTIPKDTLSALTDIFIEAESDTNNTVVSGGFLLIQKDD